MQVGITFDRCNVTSANDAHFHWTFLNKTNGVTKGCLMTHTTNSVTIGRGYFIIYGRFVQITGDETISLDPSTDTARSYNRLVYEIDLSKTNTDTEFNQGRFKVLTNPVGTGANYPTCQQSDLDNGGTIYQMPFAKFRYNLNGITDFVSEVNSINFNDIYTQLRSVQLSYSRTIDAYVRELENQGFVTQAAYHGDNTPTDISLPVGAWTYDSSAGYYKATVNCSKASAVDYCVLHIIPQVEKNKATKLQVDKALAYLYPNPTVGDGTITFQAYEKPKTALSFKVIGGIGQ